MAERLTSDDIPPGLSRAGRRQLLRQAGYRGAKAGRRHMAKETAAAIVKAQERQREHEEFMAQTERAAESAEKCHDMGLALPGLDF